MKKRNEKSTGLNKRNKVKIIAVILFLTALAGFVYYVIGFNFVSSKLKNTSQLSDNNLLSELEYKEITIQGRGHVELTEDMLPEGRTLEDYSHPIYGLSDEVYNLNDQEEDTFLSQPSDIEGMTWGDKKNSGLLTKEGADSDYDGLTDKEEIEVYKTNPKAKSTANDMYTDGYKVEHGLDPSKTYESEEDIVYPNNLCEETITINAANADGLNTFTNNVTGRDKLTKGVKIYAEYEVYNCNGKIKINLHSINENLSPDDVNILIGQLFDDKTELVDFDIDEKEDNKIVPQITFDINKHYFVFVVSADSMDKMRTLLNNIPGRDRVEALKAELAELENKDSKKIAIIYGSPLLEAFSGPKMKMIIEDTDEDINQKEREALAQEHNVLFGKDSDVVVASADNDRIKTKTKVEVVRKMETLDKFFSRFAYNNYWDEMNSDTDGNWHKLLFTYKCVLIDDPKAITPSMVPNIGDDDNNDDDSEITKVENVEDITEDIKYYEDEEPVKSHTGFDINSDEFPFENFASYISRGGNCAGISWYTTIMYNKKTVPINNAFSHYNYTNVNGKAMVLAKDGEWDISSDPENKTLLDPVLVDYKDQAFTKNNTKPVPVTLYALVEGMVDMNTPVGQVDIEMMDYDNMTAGEQNFIDMMGDYHTQFNDINKKVPCAAKGSTDYSWNTIMNIMNSLDQGRVVIIAMTGFEGDKRNGHAMVIYDYEYQPSDPDNISLWVYDSNYPMIRDFCFISVNKEISPLNGQETFSYEYNPLPFLTSDVPDGQEYSFDAYDENMNPLTEMN